MKLLGLILGVSLIVLLSCFILGVWGVPEWGVGTISFVALIAGWVKYLLEKEENDRLRKRVRRRK